MRESLTLSRQGHFELKVKGKHHCGAKMAVGPDGRLRVRYSFRTKCAIKLDQRGFLFDQLNVHKFFESIDWTDDSCEVFVQTCAKELMEQIKSEHPGIRVRKAQLYISPYPFAAGMTYRWRA